jgi:3-oxoacyl-[acyl-carrier-protein] synthase-3
MTDGSRFKNLYVPAGGFRKPSTEFTRQIQEDSKGGKRAEDHLYMDGTEIFKFSATDVVKSIQNFMESENLSTEIVDYLILHQANKFMTDKVARKLKFSPEKVPYSLKTYGNTSSASIPLTIVHNYDKIKKKKRARCLLSGFGIGLSWGVADAVLDKIFCPEVINLN